jgi:anti-sigma B factor antagonist
LAPAVVLPSGILRVAVAGDLDLATAGTLVAASTWHLESGCRLLALDLAGVTFMDSSGLGALIEVRNTAMQAGVELILARPPRKLTRVLERTGMAGVFTIDAGTTTS